MNQSINIYDNYQIDINKYPRNHLQYRITDIILITFFMNCEQLSRIIKCYEDAYYHHNECKEYYFYFEFLLEDNNKLRKNYSAKELIHLMKNIELGINNNKNNNEQLQFYLRRNPPIDIILYFYLRNKEYFQQLLNDLEKAKISYFQGKTYNIKFNIPQDFYDYKQSNMYSALEIFEIYSYSQYLVKNKIKKNLPIPKYLSG